MISYRNPEMKKCCFKQDLNRGPSHQLFNDQPLPRDQIVFVLIGNYFWPKVQKGAKLIFLSSRNEES